MALIGRGSGGALVLTSAGIADVDPPEP